MIKHYSHKEKSIVLNRYNKRTRLMKRFRIIETTIREQSFFTVEYRTFRFLYFSSWTPVMVCETMDECVRKINLVVNLKLSEE